MMKGIKYEVEKNKKIICNHNPFLSPIFFARAALVGSCT